MITLLAPKDTDTTKNIINKMVGLHPDFKDGIIELIVREYLSLRASINGSIGKKNRWPDKDEQPIDDLEGKNTSMI